MAKVIIYKGLSGSGKTTKALEFLKNNPNAVMVERDNIREGLGNYSFPKDEKLVKLIRDSMVTLALKAGKTVIISDTNLKNSNLQELITLCRNSNVDYNIDDSFLTVPLDVCIVRDKAREKSVGEQVIRRQWKEYLKENGLDKKSENKLMQYAYQDPNLPKCIIVDVDGTVAMMNGRSAYDWNRVNEDQPNLPVIKVVQTLQQAGNKLIFLSGRDAICREKTFAWLSNYFGAFLLYMRPLNDNRRDSIIKEELYNKYIKDNYYVTAVIDDRLQVCRETWHKLGLPLFRVGDPDANF